MTLTEHEDPVISTCQNVFGITTPFPWQRLIIANVLDAMLVHSGGQSTENTLDGPESLRQIAVLPTGAGKSLCWMLPAVLSGELTVAVFPLLSLMTDQKRRLDDVGVDSVTLRGGLSQRERRTGWTALESGQISIVIANPEILQNSSVAKRLGELKPKFLVIDETHTVSQWGESFRPACSEIGKLVEQWNPPVVLALTATAGPHIRDRITQLLFNGEPSQNALANPDRPAIKYGVIPSLSPNHVLERLIRSESKPLIVFGPTRSSVMNSARLLRNRLCSQEIRFYHAGLTREEKLQIEAWFLNSDDGILCATCAYGMGVDKPNIRTIIHLSQPPSVEAYLQESGRASRDGKGANAWLIWHRGSKIKIEESVNLNYSTGQEREKPAGMENPERSLREQNSVEEANTQSQIALTGSREAPINPQAVIHLRQRGMINYVSSIHSCRRTILLTSLGIKAQDCSGCDVCSGQSRTEPPEEKTIIRAIKWNRLRFSKGKLSRILVGRRSAEILRSALQTTRGFGSLSGWELEDVEEAITSLIQMKKIKVKSRWPFKGKLY